MCQKGFQTTPNEAFEIRIDGHSLKEVDSFCYLGGNFQAKIRHTNDICMRICKCRATFDSLKARLWKRREISIRTKCRIYQARILSCLLYGCEIWELTAVNYQKWEVFHAKCLRQILRVPYTEHKTNESIRKVCKLPCIFAYVRYHRLRWLGVLCRMSSVRLPKQVAFGSVSAHYKGRVLRRWDVTIRDDLQILFNWNDSQRISVNDLRSNWLQHMQSESYWKPFLQKWLVNEANFKTLVEERRANAGTGENRPFPCEHCTRSFYHERDLNIHKTKMHQDRNINYQRKALTRTYSTLAVTSVTCPVCEKLFAKVSDCRAHWSRMHFDDQFC